MSPSITWFAQTAERAIHQPDLPADAGDEPIRLVRSKRESRPSAITDAAAFAVARPSAFQDSILVHSHMMIARRERHNLVQVLALTPTIVFAGMSPYLLFLLQLSH